MSPHRSLYEKLARYMLEHWTIASGRERLQGSPDVPGKRYWILAVDNCTPVSDVKGQIRASLGHQNRLMYCMRKAKFVEDIRVSSRANRNHRVGLYDALLDLIDDYSWREDIIRTLDQISRRLPSLHEFAVYPAQLRSEWH
jgi:hypothetical protein